MSFNFDMVDGYDKFIDITERNVNIINSILEVDSSYRNAFDPEYPGSSANIIKDALAGKSIFPKDAKIFKRIITAINNENSTHFQVSGNVSGSGNGIELSLEDLMEDDFFLDLKQKLENRDPEIVNRVAKSVSNRGNFSFATKFCHYVAFNSLSSDDKDNYSIYDSVLSEVIPFYYSVYVSPNTEMIKKGRHKVKIASDSIEPDKKKEKPDPEWMLRMLENDDKQDGKIDFYKSCIMDYIYDKTSNTYYYKKYADMIDEIRKAIAVRECSISRNDFDHLLWYYYKGDTRLRQELMAATWKTYHVDAVR